MQQAKLQADAVTVANRSVLQAARLVEALNKGGPVHMLRKIILSAGVLRTSCQAISLLHALASGWLTKVYMQGDSAAICHTFGSLQKWEVTIQASLAMQLPRPATPTGYLLPPSVK